MTSTSPGETPEPQLENFSPARPRIGIALGGGSARGYAHIGVLATLEQHALAPDLIVGTSFGAVIGALYASGHTVSQLRYDASVMRRRHLLPQLMDFGLHRAALFEGRRLESYFDALTEGRHFEDLAIPLVVVATDVDTGERVLLDKGPLARALRASTAMPGVFWPVEVEGRRLVDGGLGAPIPLETLDAYEVDIRVGIGAGMTADDSPAIQLAQRMVRTPMGRRLHRSLAASRHRNPVASLGRALALTVDSWCCPDVQLDTLQVHTRPPISWLNFNRADAAIRAGEDAMARFMPRLRTALAALDPA
ncbi:MAG: patatin-like phospholipase family protein [Trueperaceae bacterium]